MLKRALTLFAVTLAAVLGATAVSAPANAARNGDVYTAQGATSTGKSFLYRAGSAHFIAYDEIIQVCDNDADSAGVILYWSINGYDQSPRYFGGGAGYCGVWDENILEGAQIGLRVCIRDNGTVITSTCVRGTAVA
jgi:hypothetical protein